MTGKGSGYDLLDNSPILAGLHRFLNGLDLLTT